MHKLWIAKLFLGALFFGTACTHTNEQVDAWALDNPASAREDATDVELPEMTFAQDTFNLGNLNQGDVVNFSIPFTNTGEAPLIISSVNGSCGCTVMKNYTTAPIPPGQSGKIDVEYNSANKQGRQAIVVSVVTNCRPSTRMVRMKANVLLP